MKALGVILSVFFALWGARWAYVQLLGTDEFEYRGHMIKMTRKYVDYDAYKNDADNILASELPKLERLMTEAKLPSHFPDWKSFVDEESKLKVPGYGSGSGLPFMSSGREFVVSMVEIPKRLPAQKFRYFVLEKLKDGSFRLADDFVDEGRVQLVNVKFQGGRLVYFDKDQAVIRETAL